MSQSAENRQGKKRWRHCKFLLPVLLLAFVSVVFLSLSGTALAESVWCVKSDAPGPTHDGSSWTDAFLDLQSALNAAQTGDQIWVAAGTYKPTDGTDRSISFNLKSGVDLYGGFAGTETSVDARDWKSNPTILSGDIGEPGVNTDNSYKVLAAEQVSGASIDAFTVTAGNDGYNGTMSSPTFTNCSFSGNSGDGLNATGGSSGPAGHLTFSGCTFSGNSHDGLSIGYMGVATCTDCTFSGNLRNGVTATIATLTLTDCIFSGNSGNGADTSRSYPNITNCVFVNNSSIGVCLEESKGTGTLSNCTFTGNSGGGLSGDPDSHLVVTNCILWGDGDSEIDWLYPPVNEVLTVTYSIVQGGHAGTGNLDADPLFVNAAAGDVHLQLGSPAIDSGTSAGAPASALDGVTRPRDGNGDYVFAFDMGAYEYPAPLPSLTLATGWNLVGNLLGHTPAALVLPQGRVAFAYDPQSGYYSTLQLQPGQGAWVKAVQGEVLEFAPVVQ